MDISKCKEISLDGKNGSHLCALINDNIGWLMYLPNDDGESLRSSNPIYVDDLEKIISFKLDNGQIDEYPLSWCLPLDIIERALNYFKITDELPTFIKWIKD